MESITLEKYKLGIISIETATRNGLRLVPTTDSDVVIKGIKGHNAEDSQLVVEILKKRRNEVLAIVSDPEGVRKSLCEAQQALSEANNGVMVLLDWLDRLEKVYRTVFPAITECINGEKGCPEDSVVFCTACSGVSHIPVRETSDA